MTKDELDARVARIVFECLPNAVGATVVPLGPGEYLLILREPDGRLTELVDTPETNGPS